MNSASNINSNEMKTNIEYSSTSGLSDYCLFRRFRNSQIRNWCKFTHFNLDYVLFELYEFNNSKCTWWIAFEVGIVSHNLHLIIEITIL